MDVVSCRFRFEDRCLVLLEFAENNESRGSKTNSDSLEIPPLEKVVLSVNEAGEIWFDLSFPCLLSKEIIRFLTMGKLIFHLFLLSSRILRRLIGNGRTTISLLPSDHCTVNSARIRAPSKCM